MARFPSRSTVEALIPEGRKPYIMALEVLEDRQIIGMSAHQSAGVDHEKGDAVVQYRGDRVADAICDIALADDAGTLEPPLTNAQSEVFATMREVLEGKRNERGYAQWWEIGDGTLAIAVVALRAVVDHGMSYQTSLEGQPQ